MKHLSALSILTFLTFFLAETASSHGDTLIEVARGVYALVSSGDSVETGWGANCGFIVGDSSVLVVDSRFTPQQASALMTAIRRITRKPISALVNTSSRIDRVLGNETFANAGAEIIMQQRAAAFLRDIIGTIRMEIKNNPRYQRLFSEAVTLPRVNKVVQDSLWLDLGNRRILIFHPQEGAAATDGDLVVYVPDTRILFTGDIVVNGYHPNLANARSNPEHWLKVLSDFEKMPVDKIIPGRGSLTSKKQLRWMRSYIKHLCAEVQQAISKKQAVDQVLAQIRRPKEPLLMEPLWEQNIRSLYNFYLLKSKANRDSENK